MLYNSIENRKNLFPRFFLALVRSPLPTSYHLFSTWSR